MARGQIVSEKDWKLFRAKLPGWQEAYMDSLNQEYVKLLTGQGAASDKFWELEKRIKEDRKNTGVVAHMSRTDMEWNLLNLLKEEAIHMDDLVDFSEELRERLAFIMERW